MLIASQRRTMAHQIIVGGKTIPGLPFVQRYRVFME
jgi:hypothetical protein